MLGTACASADLQSNSTTQTITNQGLKSYDRIVQTIKMALENAQTCPEFNTALQGLAGLRNCADQGTETTTIISSNCTEVPSLRGEAILTLDIVDCIENGVTLQGLITLDLIWNGVQLDALLTAAGFIVNGLPQSFTDLSISVDSNNVSTCSGVMISESSACGVSGDCSFCAL